MYSLESAGIQNPVEVFHNLSAPVLVEHSLCRKESQLTRSGALSVTTGERTGRSPRDKFIVQEPEAAEKVWWGEINRPVSEEAFDRLHRRVCDYLKERPLYVFDGFSGADPRHRLSIRLICESAWHNLFGSQLFIRPDESGLKHEKPDFTILSAPFFEADPSRDGTASKVFIFLSFSRRLVLIGGTQYAGEIKKSIFTVMNYLMPDQGVLPMHCSANQGSGGDVALFFGLSGTGKTTLSADPDRRLIGDDEHGWSDQGVFNFEGGCYAKCVHLSRQSEPQIWDAIRFGTVVENVVFDNCSRRIDFDDTTITENTRAAYPLDFIPGAVPEGRGGHPQKVFFLTADASGVLPPIARLNRQQSMYHFISGYTSKIAGTEAGVTDPEATFSACFAAPFLPLHPIRYALLLAERIERHQAEVYLVNTGWTGGPFGVGRRIKLAYTRALIRAALKGDLAGVPYSPHPVFKVSVPRHCPDVPDEVLDPRTTWSDPEAYDRKTRELAGRFVRNLKRFGDLPAEVVSSGPVLTE